MKQRLRRERRHRRLEAAKNTAQEVLLPAALLIALGLAFIYAIFMTQEPPETELEAMPQGIFHLEDYLTEKAAYEAAEKEEAERLLSMVQAARERYQVQQEETWAEYISQAAEQEAPEPEAGGSISSEDADILMKMAMAEAEGEDTEGKALVMLVILNRMKADGFPDSAYTVISQEDAFTSYINGRYAAAEPDEDCRAALNLIESGWDESQGALYFERTSSRSTWHSRNLKKLFVHGNHTFYTEGDL